MVVALGGSLVGRPTTWARRCGCVKSPAEQELLRAAGRLGAQAMAAALEAAVPGAREAEVRRR